MYLTLICLNNFVNIALSENILIFPRFKISGPGFEGEWCAEKLSDFSERVTRKNTNNETSLPLTISSKDGLVDQISYFNKPVASKDMSSYYLLKNESKIPCNSREFLLLQGILYVI